MKTYTLKDMWGTHHVKFEGSRDRKGNLHISLYDEEGPYARVTVILPAQVAPYNCAYLDINNFPEAEMFLTSNNIAINTGIIGVSGYCSNYPLYKFNDDFIKELLKEA